MLGSTLHMVDIKNRKARLMDDAHGNKKLSKSAGTLSRTIGQRGLIGAVALSLLFAGPAQAQMTCSPTRAAFEALRQSVLQPRADHIIVVAHRACFAAAPENTPQAIEACARLGVEVVENDVQRTKDGVLVIFHDGEISRMTDKWGYVRDMTLAQLRSARLKERDGAASDSAGGSPYLTNLPITTLEEYLAAAKNRVMINFEIKTSNPDLWLSMFDQSVAMARTMGVMDHIVFKVPDIKHHGVTVGPATANAASQTKATTLLESIPRAPDIQLMPMIWESSRDLTSRVTDLSASPAIGYEIPFQTVSYFEGVKRDRRLDAKPIMAVAVQPFWSGGLDDRLALRDPDAAWGRLIEMGADWVMTDRPETLLSYLERTGRRHRPSCTQ